MIPVCAGVILRSGAVLLARRGPGRKHAGKWEFPGGRIEEGETPQAALVRELREELGIEATVGAEAARTRHIYDFGEIELIALLVPSFTGEITLTDHDEFKWVEARRLLEYDLAPADVPIAEVIAAYRRRERYTGTHPKNFEQKYKELNADPDAIAKAKARGSTPAGAHVPIMVREILEALGPLAGAKILDCTLGWGGHASEITRAAGPAGTVIGLDRDGEELARTEKRLREGGLKIVARQSNYAGARRVLQELKLDGVDALLADLGVSSMQLDRPERGMSFKTDGPLDMRMDRTGGPTAAQWLTTAAESEIADALTRYGDEPDAAAIAKTLAGLAAEGRSPKTTAELCSAVGVAKGLGPGRFVKKDASSKHPAARTFQALRIAVNSEREALSQLLHDLPLLMRPGGRVAVLTFHSGEEALVSASLREQAAAGLWTAPPGEPRKASPEEVRDNPRSRSARLWRIVRSYTTAGAASLVIIFLAPHIASASRYDPDSDRAALRQAASLSHSTIVDATGLALVPEKVPAITAGLDEGLRQAQLAADSARSLDAAAQKRGAEMTAGADPSTLDRKLKELLEPLAAERLRWERLNAEQEDLKDKVDRLPDEEKKKLLPLLSKASRALSAAADALRPLEESAKIAAEQTLEMKAARQESLGPLIEISSTTSGVIRQADDMPETLSEAKSRLGVLGQEPRNVARSRAWEKLALLRDITRQLFEAADRACNRADSFRRRSADFEKSSAEFEARLAAGSGLAGAKSLLDEAHKALTSVRERLKS